MDVTSLFSSGNILTFLNRESVSFEFKILKVKLLDNVIISIIETPPPAPDNNNVFAYSTDGKFLWRIDTNVPLVAYGKAYCPFIDIDTAENNGYPNQLMLYNWCTSALRVNPITGEILERYESH